MVESPLLEIVETQPDICRAILSHRNLGRRLSGGPFKPGEHPVVLRSHQSVFLRRASRWHGSTAVNPQAAIKDVSYWNKY